MISGRDRLRRLTLGFLLLAAFPGAWLIQRVVDRADLSLCLFRTVTGRPCPFCGLTRAFAHAVGGNPGAAFAAHPLWWLASLAVVGVGVICLLDAARGTDRLAHVARTWRAHGWHCVVAAIIVALLSLL